MLGDDHSHMGGSGDMKSYVVMVAIAHLHQVRTPKSPYMQN